VPIGTNQLQFGYDRRHWWVLARHTNLLSTLFRHQNFSKALLYHRLYSKARKPYRWVVNCSAEIWLKCPVTGTIKALSKLKAISKEVKAIGFDTATVFCGNQGRGVDDLFISPTNLHKIEQKCFQGARIDFRLR